MPTSRSTRSVPARCITPLMEAGTTPEYREMTVKRLIPLGRFTTIEDIGEAVSFLASDRAAMITGQMLAVDGGALTGFGEDLRAVVRKRMADSRPEARLTTARLKELIRTSSRRIAINIGGGYVPGLNAVITGAVLAASELGWEVVGIRDGFDGLLFPDRYPDGGLVSSRPIVERTLHGIGGAILGTAAECDPFHVRS